MQSLGSGRVDTVGVTLSAGTNRPPNAQTKASASASLLNRRRNAVPFPAASRKITDREPRLLSQVIILLIAAMRSPQNEPTSTVRNILASYAMDGSRALHRATRSNQPDHSSSSTSRHSSM